MKVSNAQSDSQIWLVTSIPAFKQKEYEVYFNAWRNLGVNILTINSGEEYYNINEDSYRERKILADSDFRKRYGRPLVSVNEAIKKLSQVAPKNSIIGLVNSDIIPFPDFPWEHYTATIDKNSLHLFKRVDFECPEPNGDMLFGPKTYNYGYDLFLLRNSSLINNILDDDSGELAFGVPWWDYWFPCKAIAAGFETFVVDNCAIFHKSHKEQFSQDLWHQKGTEFRSYFNKICRREGMSVENDQDLISLCDKAIKFIDGARFRQNNKKSIDFQPGVSIVVR